MTIEATDTAAAEVEAVVEDASDERAAEVQAQTNAETASESAALDVLKAAREAAKAEPATAADGGEAAKADAGTEPAKTAAPIPDPAKVVPPPPAPDAESAKLLERLNQIEAAHRATQAENKTLREQAARASKYDAIAKASADGDVATMAKELGWTPEAILKYIEDGKDGVKDVVADKKIAGVVSEVQELKQQLAIEKGQREIAEYKGTISREFSSISKDVPFLVNDYTDPDTGAVDQAGMVEAIWDLQCRLHESKQQAISIEGAAKALNSAREKQLKRLQGKQPAPAKDDAASKATATPAKTQEPVTKTKPRVALPKQPAKDPHEEDALAVLRTMRLQRETSAADLE